MAEPQPDPDGGYTVSTGGGLSMRQLPYGNIAGRLPTIRLFTIADVSQVVWHEIARVYDTVSHTMHSPAVRRAVPHAWRQRAGL